MLSFQGLGIGGGIAIGRARVLEASGADVPRYRVHVEAVAAEQTRLEQALSRVRSEFAQLLAHLPVDAPAEAGALLEVHRMILDDPALAQAAHEGIAAQAWNAEWAVWHCASELADQFAELDDDYFRERGRDVLQVADRVMRALSGSRSERPLEAEPVIYCADDIAPADMLGLRHAAGFAVDLGGVTSHMAILARSMNVPAVLALGDAHAQIRDDDWLILDGDAGRLIVSPEPAVLQHYRDRQAQDRAQTERLRELVRVASRTLDDCDVELMANLEHPDEVEQALEVGAAGVGLFRTEFLFMNRGLEPGEDEQFEAYRAVVAGMKGLPVTIRTIDVGADKAIESHTSANAPNPALGLRAIRYSLAQPQRFLVQLRAILRASCYGPVRLLLPMLAHDHEIDASLALIEQARDQLRERGQAYDAGMRVGGMVEVPAAALCADYFARRLDFLSIGTNDLTQYTLAIDRADHEVASLYEPFHPAVLKLIAHTLRAARRAGKPVAVCGEMAGDCEATRVLLGLGLTQFSMQAASLLRVKREIVRVDRRRLMPIARRLLRAQTPQEVDEVRSLLRTL
jgi:phosphotransferase system enzyme I (PtsI)